MYVHVPQAGHYTHSIRRDDLCSFRYVYLPNLTNGLDAFAFYNDNAVQEWLASKAVYQCAAYEGFDIVLSEKISCYGNHEE